MACRPRAETPESRVCSSGIDPNEHGRGSGWPCCEGGASRVGASRHGTSDRRSERDPGRNEGVPQGTRAAPARVGQRESTRERRSSGRRAGAKARADPGSVREDAPGRQKCRWPRSSWLSCDLSRTGTGGPSRLRRCGRSAAWRRSRFRDERPSGYASPAPACTCASASTGQSGSKAACGARSGHGPPPTIEPVRMDGEPTTNRSRTPARAHAGSNLRAIRHRSSAGVPARCEGLRVLTRATRPKRVEHHGHVDPACLRAARPRKRSRSPDRPALHVRTCTSLRPQGRGGGRDARPDGPRACTWARSRR